MGCGIMANWITGYMGYRSMGGIWGTWHLMSGIFDYKRRSDNSSYNSNESFISYTPEIPGRECSSMPPPTNPPQVESIRVEEQSS